MEWLLKQGADPNIKCGQQKETALHAICRNGFGDEVIQLFLSHGADPDARDVNGRTPFDLKRQIHEAIDPTGWSLAKAAELGDLESVRRHLAAGIDVNAIGDYGATALHAACFTGWGDIVAELLRAGADQSIHDSSFDAVPVGWALHGVSFVRNSRGDYQGVIRNLLQAGADRKLVESFLKEQEQDLDPEAATIIRSAIAA